MMFTGLGVNWLVLEGRNSERLVKKMLANLVPIVNLLYLLKAEPKTRTELYDSGVFFGWRHLYKTIHVCKRVGLIVKSHREWFEYDVYLGRRRFYDWWVITTVGLIFLKFYDNEKHSWQIRKMDKNRCVRQVAVS